MFARLNIIPPFVDEHSESLFSNITGLNYDSDATMVATLRALLYSRLDNNQSFKFGYRSYSINELKNLDIKYSFKDRFRINPFNLTFVGITGDKKDIEEQLFSKYDNKDNGVVKTLKETGYEFEEAEDLKKYYKAKYNIDARFYINQNINNCIVVIDLNNMNIRFYHTFVALIPRYLPSIFKDKPLINESDEWALCKSLTEKSTENYLDCIQKIAEKIDIRSLMINKMLSGFEKKIKENQLVSAKEDCEAIDSSIRENENRYSELIKRRENAIIRYEGIKTLLEKNISDDELLRYMNENKFIDLVSVENSLIKIIISTYLSTFDVDGFSSFCRGGSILRDYLLSNNTFEKLEDRKLFLENIFNEDPILKVKMCGFYILDINGNVDTRSHYDFPIKYKDFIPNPHLQRHRCLGDNKRFICEQLRKGETIGAIECCIASTKAVNVFETSATFRPMIESILNSENKIITNNEGVDMTPAEALQWLKNRQNQQS